MCAVCLRHALIPSAGNANPHLAEELGRHRRRRRRRSASCQAAGDVCAAPWCCGRHTAVGAVVAHVGRRRQRRRRCGTAADLRALRLRQPPAADHALAALAGVVGVRWRRTAQLAVRQRQPSGVRHALAITYSVPTRPIVALANICAVRHGYSSCLLQGGHGDGEASQHSARRHRDRLGCWQRCQ